MKHTCFLSLAALALAVHPVFAQAPTGGFVYPGLGAGTQAIWDVSGTYQAGGEIGDYDPVELTFPMTIVQDGKGKITGAGSTDQVNLGGTLMSGSYTAKGSVKASGNNLIVTLKVSLTGTGLIEGQTRSYKISINYDLQVDRTAKHLVGSGTGSASASGLGKGPVTAQVDAEIPGGMNGTWAMTLMQEATGTKLGGTAHILLSNGRTLPFTSKGKYTAATQISALKLAGTGTASGAKLDFVATGDTMTLTSFSGSVLGNAVQR
jgi:hypothetical protein